MKQGNRSSDHMGCWHCMWRLNVLCHCAGLVFDFVINKRVLHEVHGKTELKDKFTLVQNFGIINKGSLGNL